MKASPISNVRLQHLMAVFQEEHLSEKFLNKCIDEAVRREQGDQSFTYPENKQLSIKALALRVS